MGPRTRLHPSRRIKFTAMSAIIYTTPQIGCNNDKLMLSSRIFSALGPLRCVRNIPSNVVRCLPTIMSSIYEAFGGIIRHFWRGVKVRRSPALNNCVAAHQSVNYGNFQSSSLLLTYKFLRFLPDFVNVQAVPLMTRHPGDVTGKDDPSNYKPTQWKHEQLSLSVCIKRDAFCYMPTNEN